MDRFDCGVFAHFHRLTNQKQLYDQGGQVAYLSLEQQKKLLDNIASTHQSGKFPGTILPMLTDLNVVYYVLTRSQREWRRLDPLLRAFAGPTTLKEYPVKSSYSCDRELLNLGYAQIKKFSVPKDVPQELFKTWKFRAIKAMNNLALGAMNAPETIKKPPRALAELLDNFELALGAGDQQGCNDIIDELKVGYHLDHMNLNFLRIRVFERVGDWSGLVRWQSFERICKARRPGRISVILVKGIYHTELASFGNDIGALAERFKTAVLPLYGELFRELPSSVNDEVLRTFAVNTVVNNESPHQKQLSDIVEKSFSRELVSFWNECQSYMAKKSILVDTLGDVETTFPTKDNMLSAIAVAYVEDSSEKARAVIELFNNLSGEDQSELLSRGRVSNMWNYLTKILVGDWENCFKALCTGSDDESTLMMMEALNKWGACDLIAGRRKAEQFFNVIEKITQSEIGNRRLVENLQSLVTWIMEDPSFPREEGVPVYVFLLELYALSERITSQRLESFLELMSGVLSCPINSEIYVRIVESAIVLVDQNEAHNAVDWLTDLVGNVLDHHTPDPSLREKLLWNVLLKIKALGVELSEWQREALRLLLRVLQQDGDDFIGKLPITQGTSPLSLCAKKNVAIYTLDENSGQRAKEVITTVCPLARVSINTDKVGSTQLKNLAKNSDIFIVVSRAAKHAATTDINQNRPKGKPILYPTGKGSSSILRELERYFKEFHSRVSQGTS
jgi:hypothetical protein